jgi:hypothetical protein
MVGGVCSESWKLKRCMERCGFIVRKRRKKKKTKGEVHSRQSI